MFLTDEDRKEIDEWIKKQRKHLLYLFCEGIPEPKEICVDEGLYAKLKQYVKEHADYLGQEPNGDGEEMKFRGVPLVSRKYDRSMTGV